ncbi:protein SMAX1-LIKE 7-like isoform X1 [Glycine soja]|uniref:Protein SMAX1-LIKE 7 isoform A n=2 Tax=Glycine soja TaxID=3848 RepID=A0A445I450_GLYSO|nr:protein SMAX1-LIKE 7-like isoform X1 [Glycine soja]RZB80883.1 Protein SMAX1-LIKE 7 isoform A [Glycine soja]
MPTPVSTARQCLTDEAARTLDDAVSVARRRSHAQTTSLHAVSALLSLPSASLRDACSSCRSCSYSPRLQFRALELSVGVSLDRLPTTKSGGADEGPPVSNSLMAAIKRSQANQRRHPDSFHLMQMMQHQTQTTSLLKVELKHFILSILDDPIVSRVFAEAGFRSYDIKLALLHPPPPPPSRIFSRLTPPLFLCNLEPIQTGSVQPISCLDDNCRRIVEVITRKTKRNPLLMGVYAKTALRSFVEVVKKNGKGGVLPCELNGLSVVSVEKEIGEFLREGGRGEMIFEHVGHLVEHGGGGVVVCYGEIEVFVGGYKEEGSVGFVVSQLTRLLGVHGGGKVWLLGVAGTSEDYSKFLRLFPTVDKDWDLHLLTMTSATPSIEKLYPKSSLMGSFVPFGGFFSTPSEFKNPVSCTNASSSSLLTRCDTCNESCEQEVADILKVGPAATSTSVYSSTSLPRLQKVNVDSDRGLDVAKTNEENTSLNIKIFGLQRRWSDICQRLHQNRSLPEFDITKTRFQAPSHEGFQFGPGSSSRGPLHSEIQYSDHISYMSKESQSAFPFKQILPVSVPFDTVSITDEADQIPKVSKTDMHGTWVSPSPKANISLLDPTTFSSVTPVTTDLGLGTIYTSAAHEPDTPKLSDHKKPLHHLSDSLSTDFDAMNENTSHQIARSSSCSGPNLEGRFETVDFKSLYHLLTEKVGWQDEAIYAINRTVSRCRSGAGKLSSDSHVRADIWLAFLGPDRLGKRKIASALAEILFGNKQSLITVDLSSQDRCYPSYSIFEFQNSYCHDVLMRKTVLDYIAGELSKKPHSVVFLENVDQADFLVQNSLFHAIKTGKFPYSHGREISINNAMFIVTSSVFKSSGSFNLEEDPKMFPEARILEAKRCQMQLSLGHASEGAKRSGCTNVKVAERKGKSKTTFLSKRKLIESGDLKDKAPCKTLKPVREASRSYLDLNMPLEEVEEGNNYNDDESESIVENSGAWLNDLCDQVDEKVVFKPFNFDSIAEQVIKSIDTQFQKMLGSEFILEIEYEVMTQILAAAWLSDKKKSLEDWVEHVLGRSFGEAHQKYHFAPEFVMKLVNCERFFLEEQSPGVCLPARINLN